MGGLGSGRRTGKDVTTSYRRLDVRALQRAGFLHPGHVGAWGWHRGDELHALIQVEAGNDCIRLRYTTYWNGQSTHHDYAVGVVHTACNYGGQRPWFLCPCCGKRVAILYAGSVFACRNCCGLAYAVQRERWSDRSIRRADAIRARLGWGPGIANGRGGKPKGMHWRTFFRLLSEHDQAAIAGLEGIARTMDIVSDRLSKLTRSL